MNELRGLVATKNPRFCNSPHAIHCPTRNPNPRTTVVASQGNLFSSPSETPGIDFTGANTACRAKSRRAASMVRLLISNKAVLMPSSSHGRLTPPQSWTYVLDEESKEGNP